MSNTIQTAATIVTQECLRTLLVRYPALKTLSHSFDAIPGTGVKVPSISATTAGNWNDSDGYAPIARTVNAVTVNPADWNIVYHTFSINPLEAAQVNPQIISRLAESGAHAVGRNILDSLIALCDAATVTNETPATTVDLDTLVAADAALAARGVVDPKFALMGADAFANLLSDSTIHSALVRGDTTDPVVTGRLGNVIGFPVDRYAGFTNPTDTIVTKGLIGGVDGFALVTGVPLEEQSGAVALNVVEDANSGLKALLRSWVDQKTGAYNHTIAIGVGAKIGIASALQRIVTPHS